LVASTRGAAGGYHLIRPPEQVSLGEVMQVIEGTHGGNGQACSASPDSPAVKVLMKAWQDVAAKEREMLEGISFAELLDRAKQEDGQMYYI
jgi:DNA-binding IscR family transcriptional regulator